MTINEQAGIKQEPESIEHAAEEMIREEERQQVGGFGFSLPDWLFIERLDEPVEKYVDHPFNFKKSEGLAYIIRGFAAVVGEAVNYWWMDVIGGVLRLRQEGGAAREAASAATHE